MIHRLHGGGWSWSTAPIEGRGGLRAVTGVLAFMLVALSALTLMGWLTQLAGRQNTALRLYENAGLQLEVMLRGLNELVVTEGSLASMDVVRGAVKEFQDVRRASAELEGETALQWSDLSGKIDRLMLNRRNVAFDEDSLIALGSATRSVDILGRKLDALAHVKQESAEAAERRIQLLNILVAALMVLGTATFVILREGASRKLLDAARGNAAQLRAITDNVSAVIVYVDADRRFRFHNKAMESALGKTAAQIDGRTMQEVFGDEAYNGLRPWVTQVLDGTEVRFDHAITDPAGERHEYSVHYLPRRQGDRDGERVIGFYGLITEVTEAKRIDRMKTEFVSTVSHELRTPLTSIRGSLGLLGGGIAGKLPDAAKNLVEIARKNCDRLIRLINDILDTERIESGEVPLDLKVADLKALIAQTVSANEGFAGQHQVSLSLRAPDEALFASVDTDRLVQVLTNLLSNAIKFSPAGGDVEVSLSRADANVRFEVRDRGPGIPAEFRPRIFQKFSQADSSDTRQKGGSGLGLSISKAIVERLGGTIGFTTQTGAGTVFFFELKEWREDSSLVAAQPVPHKPDRGCILVCEGDAHLARLIGMMLDTEGYNTDLAGTSMEAREMAAANRYVAMTVNLRLPDLDGIALIRQLRKDAATRDLPLVLVTACAVKGGVRINSETLTISGWLDKPMGENRMILAVRHALERRNPGRPRVLHVEDDTDVQHISAAVAHDLATFEFAATLEEARVRLLLWKFDLVLLDLNLTEGKGAGWRLIADIAVLDPPPPIVIFSASEISAKERHRVAAALVKAETSSEELLETIRTVLAGRSKPDLFARPQPAATEKARLSGHA